MSECVRSRLRGTRWWAVALAVAWTGAAEAATIPGTVDQQGRFLKADGSPETASLMVVFSVYDAATAGMALWTETQTIQPDAAGFYATGLGSVTPFPKGMWDGRTLFLGIKLNAENEMTPRQPVVSVPYALHAGEAVDAIGDIHPTSITVNGKMVVDSMGNVVGGGGGTGPKGDPGPAGAQGPAGPAGPAGPTGMTGVAGPAGPAGAKGDPGMTGGGGSGVSIDLELDEPNGTTFADSSGNGNNAMAPSGGVAVGSGGHSGKSVSFSGGVLTVPAPNKVPDSAQVWVEAWVMPLGALDVTRTAVSKTGSYALKQIKQNVSFQVIGSTSATPCVATSTTNPVGAGGKWYHVAGWYDSLNVYVAVDGTVRATVACPNGPVQPSPNSSFDIGGILGANGAVTEDYSGRIDEIRVRPTAAQNYQVNNFRRMQRVVGQYNEGNDSGYMGGRKLTFVKTRDDTLVHFIWSDNRRGIGYIYGYWDVMWNRKPCTSPFENRYWHHSYVGNTAINQNDNHYNATITGVCGGVGGGPMPAGTYDIEINLTHVGGNNSDWYMGWNNSTFMIEAEEVY